MTREFSEKYKFSKYNHKITTKEGLFIYNALSGGFCKIDDEIKVFFDNCDLASVSNLEKLSNLKEEIKNELIRGGFIIHKLMDEIKLIKSIHNISRFSNQNSLGLTLLPTLGCNFRCTYCFEKNQDYPNIKMSEEVMDAIIKFA